MLEKLSQWIDETNLKHAGLRQTCSQYEDTFKGSFDPTFLNSIYVVVTDNIPRPNIAELKQMGLGEFLAQDVASVAYKDTYYIKKGQAHQLTLHFQEMVHIVQWRELGTIPFLNRYLTELQSYGFNNTPLEHMACHFAHRFSTQKQPLNIQSVTKQLLAIH